MTDQDLLATIAGLQEQIDSMSGQLTEVRPPSISAAPSSRAVRARRGAEAGCPHRRRGPAPSTPPPARQYTLSFARRGRRGRTRDYKTARATTTSRARPQI